MLSKIKRAFTPLTYSKAINEVDEMFAKAATQKFNNLNTAQAVQNDAQGNTNQPKAADYDSKGGELMLDALCGGMLGAIFTEALNAPEWLATFDWDTAVDLYDEYRADRMNGGFKLGVSGGLLAAFNDFGFPPLPAVAANDDEMIADKVAAIAQYHGRGSLMTAPKIA